MANDRRIDRPELIIVANCRAITETSLNGTRFVNPGMLISAVSFFSLRLLIEMGV